MTKILTVVGARPQFIKASVVSRELRKLGETVREVLVHTGQHFDPYMSDVFFRELELPNPDYHLGIGGGTHGQNTGRMLEAVESVLFRERPDVVLVYGDTDSTLAGALAAAKLHIPVVHVEAGLRSFNRRMPEEINRVLTDHVSDLLFAPTEQAVENLRREGISGERVRLVGDVMYDAALWFAESVGGQEDILASYGIRPNAYALVTVHRAENTDRPERLLTIVQGFLRFAELMPVVWPLHPRTRKVFETFLEEDVFPQDVRGVIDREFLAELDASGAVVRRNVWWLRPVGYGEMIVLERNARFIATDSGGVQKEAFFYRVPCATLREETEWTELVELGWNRLCPPSSVDDLYACLTEAYQSRGREAFPYGRGDASRKIVQELLRRYG
ncbi:non-hydrolyzing UDP-N-acetylglucosamine 2-epimerase [Brockia lithotrophica]|uniref:UDP-GlcNAc3NAcA epimerase n=1 Tax=Brockia lithotrophica TaxID=933949 RepID=A0A660KYV2_9BACL|nr:UDP-N-acetylglucosamine 2-epimerase (non-hydrolyzing) [Brockia lithotrophica]RKQ85527.1 UDP-GlcNAc3NAcA epimerase [Brockia lithotrophica]